MCVKLFVLSIGLSELGKEISSPASPGHRTGGACAHLVPAVGAERSTFTDDLHVWQPQGQISFVTCAFLIACWSGCESSRNGFWDEFVTHLDHTILDSGR